MYTHIKSAYLYIWHSDAYSFAGKNGLYIRPWKKADLTVLAEKNSINIYKVIYDITSCKKGRPISTNPSDDSVTVINSGDNDITMEIPLPRQRGSEYDPRIASFMEKK